MELRGLFKFLISGVLGMMTGRDIFLPMVGPRQDSARARIVLAVSGLVVGLGLGSCAEQTDFEPRALVRQQFVERLEESRTAGFDPGPVDAATLAIPFELDPALAAEVAERLTPARRDEDRVSEILGLIFDHLGLEYALAPTRDASATYRDRQGNCLSFVHLFVAIARLHRLHPVYVEVVDYQRWRQHDGAVVSQGHIVAGLSVDGVLRTYDFLPYRPKTYRRTQVIDDLQAMAHHYNNLGAEALLRGETTTAEPLLRTAVALAPTFDKALNNLGVALARQGELETAVGLYRRGLALDPDNVVLLGNLAVIEQHRGRHEEARRLFDRLAGLRGTSPFFFLHRGQMALARGDTATALGEMTEALRRDGELPEVHLGLSRVYLALGQLNRARHHLKRALALDPSDDEALRLARLLEGR